MASTLSPGSFQAATTGEAPLEIIAAPASGASRMVTGVSIYNADSVTHTVFITRKRGSDTRIVMQQSLNSGASLQFEVKQYLADTDSMLIYLGESITDDDCDVVANWIDRTA